MFRCPWLDIPREPPLAVRLHIRTYGRTYGRRATDADQPTSWPHTLRLNDPPTAIARPDDDIDAIAMGRVA